jgi:hypothetical protein
VFDRSLLIKKRLHHKSITVLSLYVAPPIIQSCSTISSFEEPLVLDDISLSLPNNTLVTFVNFL